ncbi:carboxymuconolactone decarboxylase family protein [Pseudomonas sp. S2_B10]
MTRLTSHPVDQATGRAAELFVAIKTAFGAVPNTFADIGANSPAALEAALAVDSTLSKGSLTTQDIEVIKLAISQQTGCDYCLAAHTVIGRGAGLSKEQILAARHGDASSGNAKLDALASFARVLYQTRGTLPAEHVDAIKAAGYNNKQIVEILLAVSSGIFTNYFNRVNDTVIEFPKVT